MAKDLQRVHAARKHRREKAERKQTTKYTPKNLYQLIDNFLSQEITEELLKSNVSDFFKGKNRP